MGKEFDNKFFREKAAELGIDWILNSPYNHQSVGCVERVNQTFFSKLRKMSQFGKLDWQKFVKSATFAVNCSFNRSINTSPYLYLLRTHPKLLIDRKFPPRSEFTHSDPFLSDFYRSKARSEYIQRDIIKNKHKLFQNFRPGDTVSIFRPDNSDKFAPNWLLDYKIIQKLSNSAFLVSNGNHSLKMNVRFPRLQNPSEGVS